MKTRISILLLIVSINCFSQIAGDSVKAYFPLNYTSIENIAGIKGIESGVELSPDIQLNSNRAFKFSGESDFIAYGDILDEYTSGVGKQFSFSLWFQPDDTVLTNKTLLGKIGDSNCSKNERQYRIAINSHNNVAFIWYNGLSKGDYHRVVTGTSQIYDTTSWYHLVVNYNGQIGSNNGLDRVELYLNGEKENTQLFMSSGPLGDIEDGPALFSIGGIVNSDTLACGNTQFIGKIDEVIFYNKTLTGEEVLNIYKTTYEKIVDSISVSVTDTLIINIELSNTQPIVTGMIKVYPNPTSDILFIDCGSNYDELNNYTIKIVSSIGDLIYESTIDREMIEINISDFGGAGLYIIQVVDDSLNIQESKKILLQ